MKNLLKRIASKFGIQSSAFLWKNLAVRQFVKKIETNYDCRRWCYSNHPEIVAHWSHYQETDRLNILNLGSQLYEISKMLKARMGNCSGKVILDAGASDGMMLRAVNASPQSVGINFLKPCVEKVISDGFAGSKEDIECMSYVSEAFDAAICCETLEHTLNPVAVLNELARVTRGRIYLTIPWMDRTRINTKPEGWPEVESHVFEFSREDFRKIVTFSDVKIVYEGVIEVFPRPKNWLLAKWIGYWMEPHFFAKLQYYELEAK